MENKMQVFSSEQFGHVRAIMRDGEPWFVAADVCKALEIANNRDALTRIDDDEKGVALADTLGGKQEVAIVNEPGLYSLVLGSRKPEAKAFKRWVTSDILPSIRRTGGAGILAGIGLNTPHYQTVGNIRCYESSGVAYLDLEAVAKGLGITKKANSGNEVVHWTRLREYLADFGVVQKCTTGDFIPENIFYRLAMKVRGEVAERFQAFIADEVIPSIRRTGGYVANEDMFLNTYLPHADEPTRAMFHAQLQVIRSMDATIARQQAQLAEQQPKAEFADRVANTDGLLSMSNFAKVIQDEHINMGRNKLFEWLRNQGYLRGNNEPYQQYVNQGLFRVRETVHNGGLRTQTYVTGKGQLYLVEKLKTEFCVA